MEFPVLYVIRDTQYLQKSSRYFGFFFFIEALIINKKPNTSKIDPRIKPGMKNIDSTLKILGIETKKIITIPVIKR